MLTIILGPLAVLLIWTSFYAVMQYAESRKLKAKVKAAKANRVPVIILDNNTILHNEI